MTSTTTRTLKTFVGHLAFCCLVPLSLLSLDHVFSSFGNLRLALSQVLSLKAGALLIVAICCRSYSAMLLGLDSYIIFCFFVGTCGGYFQ